MMSLREFDWTATALGPRAAWSPGLTAIYEMMLASPYAMCAGWGPDLTLLYNDAYVAFLADRHPAALGQPIEKVWYEVWDDIQPLIRRALAGECVQQTDMHLIMTRNGQPEDTYWSFAYSQLVDEGRVVGFLDIAVETTEAVEAARRRDTAENVLREQNTTLEREVSIRTEARDLFAALIEHLPVGVSLLDHNGGIVVANPAFRALLPNDPLPSRMGSGATDRWWAVDGLGQRLSVDQYPGARALRGELSVPGVEFRYQVDDERQIWTAVSGVPLKDVTGQVTGAIIVLQDIDAQKRALDVAQANAERVQLALAAGAIIGTWVWDLPSDRFSVDEAFARSFGLDPALGRDDIPLAKIVATVHPDDQAGLAAAIDEALGRGGRYAHQYRVRRKDGQYYWLEANGHVERAADGTPLRFPGVLIDVDVRRALREERDRALTELRQLNETLEQQVQERTGELRLYRDIVQSDPSPILAFDTRHRLTGFNRAHYDEFVRVMNHHQQVGENLPDLFPPEQATVLRGLMDRALAGEAFTVVEEFGEQEFAKPTWEIAYTPLRDASGEVIGAFHHARDISARMRAEYELNVVQDQLRQSQKMEAVGQLTGGVAHDFNNLLTIIRSSVDFLRRPDLPAERRDRYLNAVTDTVERAAKLTGQLLAFARRQALKPEVFDVGAKLRSIGDMLDTVTGARVHVAIDAPSDPCFIKVDLSQFETALINMAVNARDAMDGEGRLTLRLVSSQVLPSIRGHASSETAFAAISVGDTGCGIPPEQLLHIFEPFYTTKEVGKGTGLGLSQVFGFAKQSGGDVDVTSTVGAGTTFTLYLPEERIEAMGTPSKAPEVELRPVGHGQRVLVVEDNIQVGQFCTQILTDLGYRPEWVANAEVALAKLGADGGGFDAVFSDVVMPGIGGVALAKALRAQLPDLPVVLTSGYSHILAQETDHGFELVQKPYSAEQLGRVLEQVIVKSSPGNRSRDQDRGRSCM